ncbi:FHA domain-containing protein, partial [Agromyces sp. H66]|uniref:FHA domain-containing protein n=1 Tax=Agromyces sp. H66 TaxID=2529859 RepID=UPI0010AA85A6
PAVPVAPAVPAAPATSVPARVASTIPLPPSADVAAEQTIVPAEDTVAGPATPPPFDGDHDGLTVASIDLHRLRAERAARAGAAPESDPPVAGQAPAAPLRLRMSDGAFEALGHEIVLGRAPSVSQVSGGRLPRLITIGAGDPDISRNHVRIAVEGDTVVVTDLHSRNGTHVVPPGKPPVKLRGGEPTPVLAGTVVDLGGGWTVQVVAE